MLRGLLIVLFLPLPQEESNTINHAANDGNFDTTILPMPFLTAMAQAINAASGENTEDKDYNDQALIKQIIGHAAAVNSGMPPTEEEKSSVTSWLERLMQMASGSFQPGLMTMASGGSLAEKGIDMESTPILQTPCSGPDNTFADLLQTWSLEDAAMDNTCDTMLLGWDGEYTASPIITNQFVHGKDVSQTPLDSLALKSDAFSVEPDLDPSVHFAKPYPPEDSGLRERAAFTCPPSSSMPPTKGLISSWSWPLRSSPLIQNNCTLFNLGAVAELHSHLNPKGAKKHAHVHRKKHGDVRRKQSGFGSILKGVLKEAKALVKKREAAGGL
jgi:hypothetical protein